MFISSCIASYNPLYIILYIPVYMRIADETGTVGDVFYPTGSPGSFPEDIKEAVGRLARQSIFISLMILVFSFRP